MDLLGDIGLTDIGAGTVVVIFVLLLATGKLVTRKSHLDRIQDLKENLLAVSRERDDWKAASTLDSKSLATALAQQAKAMEGAYTAEAIAQAMLKVMGDLNAPTQDSPRSNDQ